MAKFDECPELQVQLKKFDLFFQITLDTPVIMSVTHDVIGCTDRT